MPEMRDVESVVEKTSSTEYDLLAEERSKRRYYFVATPAAIAACLTVVFASMAVLPDRYWVYGLAAGFVVMQVVEEFIMIPLGQRDRVRRATRRAVHLTVGGFLAAWLFNKFGFRAGP